MLTLSNTLHSSLQGKHVFVDSSSLVHARDSKDFYKLLHTLADNGSLLFTVPSVRFEFTRYANTIMEYNEFNRFINGLSISVFNRVEEVITFDVGNNIKTEALYQINDSRLEKVLKQLS